MRSGKGVLVAIAVALVLAFGFGGREETPAAEPVSAALAPPAVPLAVSETVQPPGWVDPDERTPEEQLYAWMGDVGRAAPWQAAGALITLAVLAVMVVALEKFRAKG